MSPAVHVVTVGAGAVASPDPDGARVVGALAAAGVTVTARVFVDEDEPALEAALAGEGGLTVIVAGPGGSDGDVVRRVLARVTGARLALNDRMLAAIEDAHRKLDRAMPRRAERLALLPQGATLWIVGGAEPAWALDTARGAFVVLPRGADAALDATLHEQLVPLARARLAGRPVAIVHTLKTAGVGVVELEERLIDWLGADRDVSVVVVPAEGEAWVRLRARGATPADAAERLAEAEPRILAALGADCYGREGETLEQVVGALLKSRGLVVATAESCTGGLVGHRLTSVGGSSAYFERGVVVYSNAAKIELLGVPESVLRAHGAVSGETAEAMARGVCAIARTPCGLSITGIAGPDGGTPAKPVGTVYIGVAVNDRVMSRRFRFSGDRASIKWQSSSMALDMLRRTLGGP
ncbi:MAG: nicotinamide-nucleotide amidohydrolase family protein [Candidatus Rokubacteria bacterium]|nr:nicotinamide-nucleotide amidohydrolase family protein [Candidatus Rokubacteria bacterium]